MVSKTCIELFRCMLCITDRETSLVKWTITYNTMCQSIGATTCYSENLIMNIKLIRSVQIYRCSQQFVIVLKWCAGITCRWWWSLCFWTSYALASNVCRRFVKEEKNMFWYFNDFFIKQVKNVKLSVNNTQPRTSCQDNCKLPRAPVNSVYTWCILSLYDIRSTSLHSTWCVVWSLCMYTCSYSHVCSA
jgi:hypothetical protein